MKHILRNTLCLLLLAGLTCLLPDARSLLPATCSLYSAAGPLSPAAGPLSPAAGPLSPAAGSLSPAACPLSPAACAEEGEMPEWTVMLYMCGSDLESRHGLGTYNLNDIMDMWFPEQTTVARDGGVALEDWRTGRVNVIAQTGGASAWHGLEPDEDGRTLGVDIAADRLQRYAFRLAYQEEAHGYAPEISLVDEQPLASMGDAGTLSDYIRWVGQNYPAKKYALVLWDHGGGSRTGLFVDELFDNDILYLHELGRALGDGGLRFELVAIDACLMCSLETARTLAPYANYMVASEEVVAGYGSAFADWLEEIGRNPGCDGMMVGCEFCDATQRKYDLRGNTLEETQLTFAVIDLSRVDAVAEGFDRLFEFAGLLYEQMPARFNVFCSLIRNLESYGMGGADMYDLGSFLNDRDTMALLDPDVRNALAGALEEAVYYTVKGSGRSDSKGLSFCFAPDLAPEDMDLYALNCQSAPYLALLDAMNADWTAPDWVYGQARRLAQVEDMDSYDFEWTLEMRDGLPALRVVRRGAGIRDCHYRMYRLDDDSGILCLLGETNALADWDDAGDALYVPDTPATWPAAEDQLCSIELIEDNNGVYLYNVPVQLGDAPTNLRLRATREFDDAAQLWRYSYDVLGLWDGYDEDTRMPSRALTSLYEVEGQEFEMLYPSCDTDGTRDGDYLNSDTMTMIRGLEIESTPLPAGTYYVCFSVRDIFGRSQQSDMVRLEWDGEAFTLVE